MKKQLTYLFSNQIAVNSSNEYRKQMIRMEAPSLDQINALKKEVESLTEENEKLQRELLEREELMSTMFSFLESNKIQVRKS